MKLDIKDHKDLNEFLGVDLEEGTYYFHIPGLCFINPIKRIRPLFYGDGSDNYEFFNIELANGFLFIKDGFIFEKTNSNDNCIEWSFNITNCNGDYVGHITKENKR